MNNVPVVITRPLKQAESLADEISAVGRHPVIFPLLEIKPADDQMHMQSVLAQLSQYACVIFVSPSAIDSVMPYLRQWPQHVSIGVVGEGSRLALSQYHDTLDNVDVFAPENHQQGDSEGLLSVLPLDKLRHQQVLIVRGQNGRNTLEKTLLNQNVAVHYLAAYQRSRPDFTAARQMQLSAILREKNDWIFTSSEALHTFKLWIEQDKDIDLVAQLQHQRIIVTHPHIQDTAHRLGLSHVVLSGTGNKQLIAFLQN